MHTPGPWRVSGVVNARYLNGIGDVLLVRREADDDNRYVAMMGLDAMGFLDPAIRTTEEERTANARLIAAAPDLHDLAASFSIIEDAPAAASLRASWATSGMTSIRSWSPSLTMNPSRSRPTRHRVHGAWAQLMGIW